MRHRTILLIIFLTGVGNLCLSQDISRLRDSITANNLQKHIEFLCDEQKGGRKFASKEEADAANYIRDLFNRSELISSGEGFENYFQNYTLTYDTLMKFSIENQNYHINYISDFFSWEFCFLSDSNQEEIVYAGFGLDSDSYSDYRLIDVENKWVVVEINSPLDNNGNLLESFDFDKPIDYSQINLKKDIAKRNGAKGVIFRINSELYPDFLASNTNAWYHYRSKEMTSINNLIGTYPAIFTKNNSIDSLFGINTKQLNDEINTILIKRISPAGIFNTSVSFNIQKDQRHFHSQNVIGIIAGKDENVGLIISAHYDAVGLKDSVFYPGANDNASGTAALIELSKALSKTIKAGNIPEKSIAFVAFSGEEEGLVGSDYFVKNLPFKINSNLININIDGIGFLDPTREEKNRFTYLLTSKDEIDRIKPIVEEQLSRIFPPFSVVFLDDSYSSDHFSFFNEGYRAFCFMTGGAKNHTPDDTPETISYQNFESVTRYIFDFIQIYSPCLKD